MGELTSANTAPYVIPLSIIHSVDPLISGEYSFNKFSSSWSDERRDSAYANIISWLGWGVAKIRTAVLAENRNSKYPACFPMATASVLLYQNWGTSWRLRLTEYRERGLIGAPIIIEKTLSVDDVAVLSYLFPN